MPLTTIKSAKRRANLEGSNRSILAPLILCIVLLSLSVITNGKIADFDSAATLYKQKDYNAAFAAFMTLSEAGDPRAKTVLAMMYKYGEGTPQDMTKALAWYESAAEQGYALAQFHTGNMYVMGSGVEPDPDRAFLWLTLASDQGLDAAINKLDELSDELPVNRNPDEVVPWSKNWDFRLPNSLQLSQPPYQSQSQLSEGSKQKVKYRVQVGAMQSHAAAVHLWQLLQETHADLFAQLLPRIILSEATHRRIYRIQAGPFSNHKEASRFCERLLSQPVQAGCLPIKVL